jgi:transposase
MESTAQYWKPVWQQLEGQFELYLAQAHSNRAPRGRKRDFADAERLLRRHVAGELILSFVPNPEQDARIKLSGCISDLLGVSGRAPTIYPA